MQVQAALDDGAQHLDLDRFFTEIIGTEGDGAKRVLAFAVAGDDDHLGLRRDAQDLRQRRKTFADAVGVGRQSRDP